MNNKLEISVKIRQMVDDIKKGHKVEEVKNLVNVINSHKQHENLPDGLHPHYLVGKLNILQVFDVGGPSLLREKNLQIWLLV